MPIFKSIEVIDREGMELIESLDAAGFVAYLKRTRNTICGRHPISVLLRAIEHMLELAANADAFDKSQSGEDIAKSGESVKAGQKRKSLEKDLRPGAQTKTSQSDAVDSKVDGIHLQVRIKFISYAQSGKVQRENESSVSYASAFCCIK
jgi:predicted class III extradiol MEMO1 family dioxygenase